MSWAVVYTDPQAEPDVVHRLERQGFGTFLPHYLIGAWYRNKLRWTEAPLLPRYLFVQLDETADWSSIVHTNGVDCILLDAGSPARVPHASIAELMIAHASGVWNQIMAKRDAAGRYRRKQLRRRRRPRPGRVATGAPLKLAPIVEASSAGT